MAAERVRRDLTALLHRGSDVREFSLGAARTLGRAVPFDGFCLLTMDPATQLPTGEVVENGLPAAARRRMAEIEIGGEDYNRFAALARAKPHVASLSASTNGDLARSRQHRELKRPNGFGDELRAALVDDAATWGGLTLLRASGRRHFAPDEAALVASLAPCLAEGLRRAILMDALPAAGEGRDAAGLVLLAADNSIATTNAAADEYLGDLRNGEPVPRVVAAVATRARCGADGVDGSARARVRTPSGRWLVVRGSALGDGTHTAVTIEPARPYDLAPLIADAYGLTERERTVTELVARGLATSAIAARLHLSPWTVQDHLKAIFEKVGVTTRGELVARVFFGRLAPRLDNGAPHEKTS